MNGAIIWRYYEADTVDKFSYMLIFFSANKRAVEVIELSQSDSFTRLMQGSCAATAAYVNILAHSFSGTTVHESTFPAGKDENISGSNLNSAASITLTSDLLKKHDQWQELDAIRSRLL